MVSIDGFCHWSLFNLLSVSTSLSLFQSISTLYRILNKIWGKKFKVKETSFSFCSYLSRVFLSHPFHVISSFTMLIRDPLIRNRVILRRRGREREWERESERERERYSEYGVKEWKHYTKLERGRKREKEKSKRERERK